MVALMNCPLHEINRMSSKIDTLNDLPMHQHHVGPEDNIYIFIQEQGEAHDGITWRPDIGILNQLGQECHQKLTVQRQGRCRDGAELRRPNYWMAACRSCWSAFVCRGQRFDFHQIALSLILHPSDF
ncbi:hypothetical protein D6C87_04506 [Aureobasidium pullulans]|uniref:Uncharacterized protein n=1 Tax=Aureobasidium pullulans TaxID=5580 RepID=A0AB38LNI0_AURPU|nr:hypothetical protein D6C94_09455 [Aureobasidium pullulans]THZ43158.1 hypothetical protein D6C87_04506 [Aureobasidium pullulans]